MLQQGSFVNIIDNSGAKKGLCIKLLNAGYGQKYGSIGDTILISVKSTKNSKNIKVKKGSLYPAVIVRTKIFSYGKVNYSKYFDNAVVLLTKQNKLLGTRIFSSIPSSFKYTRFLKLTTLSYGLIY